ncbi:MAG: biotin--[acetyl-CoA-carboxylase] ligase [Omnitrophica bacterium RIFCSPHIGHO2_02_FULL_45_28]|nr:MAG: biotin--[acetyl-CoA-carboxylase] ligase [Omnitrophica bacterium RIFCSPHIGHO2_02_FULL_45_28]
MKFRILHYGLLDSTNNLALILAKEGASEGTVVCADYQSKGRGRFDRKWVSPRRKNLLFSVILRPCVKVSRAPLLTILAAQVLVDVLTRKFGLPAKIKRPNDVLVNQRKIAGILTESAATSNSIDHVILGVGLNVNSKKRELLKAATSIYEETKRISNREELLNSFLSEFEGRYRVWLTSAQG